MVGSRKIGVDFKISYASFRITKEVFSLIHQLNISGRNATVKADLLVLTSSSIIATVIQTKMIIEPELYYGSFWVNVWFAI